MIDFLALTRRKAYARALGAEWYKSPWFMFVAGYVFAPFGLYLMWRYRTWPRWIKSVFTLLGSIGTVVSTYLSLRFLQ